MEGCECFLGPCRMCWGLTPASHGAEQRQCGGRRQWGCRACAGTCLCPAAGSQERDVGDWSSEQPVGQAAGSAGAGAGHLSGAQTGARGSVKRQQSTIERENVFG